MSGHTQHAPGRRRKGLGGAQGATPADTPSAPVFTALADEMRRSLVQNLARSSPKTATRLAQEYTSITRQGILKHLKILEAAGLVSVQQQGREKRFSLTPEPLRELEQWVREIGAIWDERLLRLKTLLEQEPAGE